jgi:hypothetical protein
MFAARNASLRGQRRASFVAYTLHLFVKPIGRDNEDASNVH